MLHVHLFPIPEKKILRALTSFVRSTHFDHVALTIKSCLCCLIHWKFHMRIDFIWPGAFCEKDF